MIKVRKKTFFFRHAGVLLPLAALAIALAVHAALLLLTGYQQEHQPESVTRAPGIQLLSWNTMTAPEWTRFLGFLAVHDPAVIARSDNPNGYAGLWEDPPRYEIGAARPLREPTVPERRAPSFPRLARTQYQPLRLEQLSPPLTSAPRAERPVTLLVLDETGTPLTLPLRSPIPKKAIHDPTVISLLTAAPGLHRLELMNSCGAAELDQLAMQTIAGVATTLADGNSPRSFTIYWPGTAAERPREPQFLPEVQLPELPGGNS